jgi:hypothetical protein
MGLQPDVTGLLLDRELGAVQFTIIRSFGKWTRGRFETTHTAIPYAGNIQPAANRELRQIPEGDHLRGAIVIRSPNPIYVSDEEFKAAQPGEVRVSDEIEWRGDVYKVLSAFPWLDFGWIEAYAVKKG